MNSLRVYAQGIGLLGPGIASWAAAQSMLRGSEMHVSSPTVLPLPARLPSAERRRAGPAIRVAMAVADEAVAASSIDAHTLATVFSSSSGEGVNCHVLCETLASADRLLSPTRFTNSVHNAAAGYWHIAVASRAPSTSLCAFGASFSAGLIEAATQVRVLHVPVLLVASDTPYPQPLHACRPLPDTFGVALVLTPTASRKSLAALDIELDGARAQPIETCDDASLEALRDAIPAARALPLLRALAQGDTHHRVVLDHESMLCVHVSINATIGAS